MAYLSFPQLNKLAKSNPEGLPVYRLAVVGDCATQHLSTAIRGTGISKGVDIKIFDADYDQILAQTEDAQSELYGFAPDGIFIMMCTEKLYARFNATPAAERPGFADREYAWISSRWQALARNGRYSVIQSLFTEYDDRIYGSFAARLNFSFIYQLRRLNMLICDGAAAAGNIYPADFSYFASEFGYASVRNSALYAIAKIPFSTEALSFAAETVADIILALRGKLVKCMVLDLDNTLWGGTIGDVGVDGIQIGELGIGRAFSAFQTWLKELKNRGILLAVCSKNDENTAKEPFLRHPEMVLKLEDIAVFVANWQPKSENIKFIQKTLNIGMDSLVFIDDRPFERNEVKTALPEVTVPEMPEDPAEYVNFLRRENLFDAVSYSAEDAGRTDMYRAEAGRQQAAEEAGSYEDYLKSLDMVAEARSFTKFWYPRIAQLSQRSNQFNLRTVRYTDAEIEEIAQNPDFVTLYFTLNDRFGDSGLISAVIMKPLDKDTLFVDTWIMSCRVLKRTMEEFIVNKMISAAREKGYKKIIGEYLPTPKNAMVKDIYSRMGFKDAGNGRFEAVTADFTPNTSYIKEKED